MNGALVEPKPWSGRRWWSLAAVAFGMQVGLVCWLGQRQFPPPRSPAAAPVLQLTGPASAELLALTDPTLFILPHRQGFSGPLWLIPAPSPYRPLVWSEPPAWLALEEPQLGATFRQFVATNAFTVWRPTLRPTPQLMLPPLAETAADCQRSTLGLTGELAGRRLLTPLELPSWANGDILKNTEVEVLVAADGRPISATLLHSSGLSGADQHALAQARKARFLPLNSSSAPESAGHPLAGLAWGELIFQWHTLPLAETDSPTD